MKAIVVTIETLQPVLATSFQGDPNSDVSYAYIPGSMIRGAIIGRYMKQHKLSDLDLTNSEVKRLFFADNSTQYLNAYLVGQDNKRTLPVPRSWFKDKNQELSKESNTTVCDFSRITFQDRGTCDGRNEDDDSFSPKPLGYDFCTVKGLVTVYSVERRINIHNLRHRQKGRSLTDKRDPVTREVIEKREGEIFQYNAIDAGQTFQTVILCQDKDEETITSLLEIQDIWFGGSRSAGYGHCKIEHKVVNNWTEVGVSAEKRLDREDLMITLLSDAILRDDNCGQHIASHKLIKEAIEQKLDRELTFKSAGVYSSSTLIGGFNRKWGLPLPQVPAIAAGSVFVFEGIKLTSEQIQQLEKEGIGERKNEGFGRIAVNWLKEETHFKVEVFAPTTLSSESSLIKISQKLAETIAERIMRQRLEKKLLDQIGRTSIVSNANYISNSQLSRLALIARQGLQQKSLDPVKELLKTENLTKNALDQFQQTKIKINNFSNQSLYDLLNNWLDNSQSWISKIQELEVTIDHNIKQSLTKELKELADEYTLRLIIAVAKKAIKEEK